MNYYVVCLKCSGGTWYWDCNTNHWGVVASRNISDTRLYDYTDLGKWAAELQAKHLSSLGAYVKKVTI